MLKCMDEGWPKCLHRVIFPLLVAEKLQHFPTFPFALHCVGDTMASITLFHCFYLPYPKLVRYHPILGYHAINPSSINSHWVYICIR